jgi:hypothetical protein
MGKKKEKAKKASLPALIYGTVETHGEHVYVNASVTEVEAAHDYGKAGKVVEVGVYELTGRKYLRLTAEEADQPLPF